MIKKHIQSVVDQLAPFYTALWEELCTQESPSDCKQALDQVVARIQELCREKGYTITEKKFKNAGNFLRIDLAGELTQAPIVLMAHLDTVHKIGAFGSQPVKIEGDTIFGPGVVDCKGGAVEALLVLETLMKSNLSHRPVRVLLTTDEEVGSRFSGPEGIDFIRENVRDAAAVLNCETGRRNTLTVGRKGIARLKIDITGKSAHAGNAYFDGASAICEAAHKILTIERLSQPEHETYNCGVISGGTQANVVPAQCSIVVDIRSFDENGLSNAVENVRSIVETSFVPGTCASVSILSCRPPMAPTIQNKQLFEKIKKIAKDNGLESFQPVCKGGGSDATYPTQLGIPTVCSCGVVGMGEHTLNEQASISSLRERTLLLVLSILQI